MNEAQKWARQEILRDRKNIEELKEARHIAWEKKDMRACRDITSSIRELNQGIRNLMESYGVNV